jgi:hypothetical protein
MVPGLPTASGGRRSRLVEAPQYWLGRPESQLPPAEVYLCEEQSLVLLMGLFE